MAQLQYKTRGMVSPQGKPRVYFCCHPGDFSRYFEEISEDLLKKQNCAVWYTTDTERDEQFWSDLSQMQLFVMPVTTELLCTPNPALDQEFPFALQNRIPVLPLMQEKGLDSLFNEKCGDLQYLDKHNEDATAISYDEKLQKYLDAVLIGDELAEKIRAAFDAYVFLSYRKKDRKYAQELMRLIHKNDFCRDLAIWYDEFLTPGENFNDSIRQALEKSGLFVLTVTPNLVNEDNYIMTTEYPMARESGKPILPAELVPTDKKELADKYQGIPEPTNAHDAPALTDALMQALRRVAILENDGSPEHNFFIGLAYLGGVDVEVDYDRALSLITGAAKDGLLEAVDKLIEMYRTGLGVVRSYRTAVQWREEKLKILQQQYEQDPTDDNMHNLFWEIIYCGDQYSDIGDQDHALEKFIQARDLVCARAEETGDRALNRDLGVSYNRMGNIYREKGQLTLAREHFERSLAAREEIARAGDTITNRRDLAVSYNKLAAVCKAEGQFALARQYYEKGLECREQVYAQTKGVEDWRDLSIAYNNMGDLYSDEKKLDKAREYFEKALAIREQLVKINPTLDYMRSLSISYNKLAGIYEEEGNIPKAKEYFLKSMEIREDLVEQTGTITARRDLTISYNRLGCILLDEGDIAQAIVYFQKSLDLRQELVEEAPTVETRADLSVVHNHIGNAYRQQRKLAQARAHYEAALKIREKLFEETGTLRARKDLAISDEKMGMICRAEGDLQMAAYYYKKQVQSNEYMVEHADNLKNRRSLTVAYNKMGGICQAIGDLEQAKQYYADAMKIREKIVEQAPTLESCRDLALSYENMADLCWKKGDLEEARAYYEKQLALRLEVDRKLGTAKTQMDISSTCVSLGNVCDELKDWAAAGSYYQQAVQIREMLFEQSPTLENRRRLSLAYNNLAGNYGKQGDPETARRHHEKAVSLREQIYAESNDTSDKEKLAASCYRLALVTKDEPRQQLLLRRSLTLYEELAQAYPDKKTYQVAADRVRNLLKE